MKDCNTCCHSRVLSAPTRCQTCGPDRDKWEPEQLDIDAWLDKWMETNGHDFPVRVDDDPGRMKNSTIMRVQILAHICHASIGSRKTAQRICLEQQALREKAEQERDTYKRRLTSESMAAHGREVDMQRKVEHTRSAADSALDQEIALREAAEQKLDDIRSERDALRGQVVTFRKALERLDKAVEAVGWVGPACFSEEVDEARGQVQDTLADGAGKPEAEVVAASVAWAAKWRPGPDAQVEEDGHPIGMNDEAWALIQAVQYMQKERRGES